jgi:hypothetical protein
MCMDNHPPKVTVSAATEMAIFARFIDSFSGRFVLLPDLLNFLASFREARENALARE